MAVLEEYLKNAGNGAYGRKLLTRDEVKQKSPTARLESLVGQIEDAFARGDVAGVLEGDRLFHATLVTAARSPRLSTFHTQLQHEQRLALSLAERSSRALGRSADDHRVLLEALRATQAQADAQVATHLQAGAAELLRLRDLLTQRNRRQADAR